MPREPLLTRPAGLSAPRVAILTPFASPSVGGNATTVERITRGLRRRGVNAHVWDLSVALESVLEFEMTQFSPTLIHAFHAYRTGPVATRLARGIEAPLVVTMTGTDTDRDIVEPDAGPNSAPSARVRCGITVFHD